MIKKYRHGKVIEQQATFDEMSVRDKGNGSRVIQMTPQWDTYTPELSYWQNEILDQVEIPLNDWIDELP
jgi:hypothetical protein